MNKKEKEILNIEQSFKDTLENEIAEQNTENKKVEIKDIKYVGKATWKDKVNGKDISDAVFIVEKQIKEIDENGKERITEQKNYLKSLSRLEIFVLQDAKTIQLPTTYILWKKTTSHVTL